MPEITKSPCRIAGSFARGRRRRALTRAAACLGVLALGFWGCGGDVEARMAEVRALQDVGQFTASIDELREILAMAPDLPEASYRLGVALVQTGEPSRAIWALEKAAESEEFAIPAGLLLASAHFSMQNFESCVTAANRVLELDPERLVALRLRAKGHLGAGDLDAALEDSQRLIELFPDDYGVLVLHASILADAGRYEESEAAHARVKEVGMASGDPAVAHRACIAPAMFAKDYVEDQAKTEALYDDCVKEFPTNGFVIGEAMRYHDQIGKPDEATEIIRSAVEAAPENLSLRSSLANRLRNQGDDEGAEQTLLEAVESFKSAGAWNLLANYYRVEKQPEKALEAIEKVGELSGGGTDQLRFSQADVLIDLGRLEEAEKVAASLEEPTYTTLLRGRIALEQGDAARALELFEQGIRTWPNNSGARYLAGRAAYELGDTERAASELREAVRADKQSADAAVLLARIHYERGEYKDAVRFGKAALKRKGANPVDVLVVGARSLTALGEYDEARITTESLRQATGDVPRYTIERARIEHAATGPAAAVAVITQSDLDLSDPANDVVLRYWVERQLDLDKDAVALARVESAVAAHPEHAPFHELLGQVLWRAGRGDAAQAAYERALELDPKHAPAKAGLATLAASRDDLPEAIEAFDAAAELTRGPEAGRYLYAAAQLTLVSGDPAGAERRLREAVRLAPGHAGARNDLAWILAEQGKELDYALALAEEARRLDTSPEILDTLGWVRFKRGESTAAVAALEEAAQARSGSPSIRYRLGLALSQAGERERAREALRAAIAAGEFRESADAQRELARLEQP